MKFNANGQFDEYKEINVKQQRCFIDCVAEPGLISSDYSHSEHKKNENNCNAKPSNVTSTFPCLNDFCCAN